MPRKFWLPSALADQITLFTNFKAKISSYATELGFTPAQVLAAQELCTQMISAYNYAEASRTTMQSVTQWRDLVFNGEPMGTPASAAPLFTPPADLTFTRGCVQQFMRLRDQIVANDKYTTAIGEDLGIVGPQVTPPSPESVSPNLKVSVTEGESVLVTGSMQGMNALRMVYTPKGGEPREVAFITSTPAGFTITKADPDKPENGELRAVFFKKNLPFGNPSPIYPITLS